MSQETSSTAEQIEITLNDLSVAATVIGLAVKRGAIEPGEMAAVGATYNKLVAFLNRVQEATKQAEVAPAAEQPELDTTDASE